MSLDRLIDDAVTRGLTHLSLTKLHARATMWQASSKFSWSSGYHVEIGSDPIAAVAVVLEKQPSKPEPVPSAALPAVASCFD